MNPSGLQPVGRKIILKPEETRQETPGGILLPDTVKFDEKHSFVNGTVLAVGGGAFKDSMPPVPQVGDMVRIHPHSGAWITGRDEKEYLIVEDKYVEALLVSEKCTCGATGITSAISIPEGIRSESRCMECGKLV